MSVINNLFDTVWKPAIVMHNGKPLRFRGELRRSRNAAPKPTAQKLDTEGGHFVAHAGKQQ